MDAGQDGASGQAGAPDQAGASGATAPSRQDRLRTVLEAAFRPARLEVSDDSALHAGHSGAAAAGQTHYSVLVVSDVFRGKSRVERHRAIHAVLDAEFGTGLHALALTLRTPEELPA